MSKTTPEPSKLNPRELRLKLGINQHDFWSPLGVTQSGGSRYENGRNMPKPVMHLVRLAYVENVDLENVNQEDMAIIAYMKEHEPELFSTLRKSARKAAQKARR